MKPIAEDSVFLNRMGEGQDLNVRMTPHRRKSPLKKETDRSKAKQKKKTPTSSYFEKIILRSLRYRRKLPHTVFRENSTKSGKEPHSSNCRAARSVLDFAL
jgi:hypothetical protein